MHRSCHSPCHCSGWTGRLWPWRGGSLQRGKPVAICKYTGKGTGLGWQRISNIAEVKLFIYEYDSVLYRIEPVI